MRKTVAVRKALVFMALLTDVLGQKPFLGQVQSANSSGSYRQALG